MIGPHPFQKKLVRMVKTAESEWLKIELLDLQRWEDEGGPMIETGDLMPGQPLVHLVPVYARKRAKSLQWSKGLVIEPFQPGNGILRDDMKGKGRSND